MEILLKISKEIWDASVQRRHRNKDIRRLKDQRNQLDKVNDKIAVTELNKQIKAKTVYYKQVSEQVGLSPKLNRLRVYDGRKVTQAGRNTCFFVAILPFTLHIDKKRVKLYNI